MTALKVEIKRKIYASTGVCALQDMQFEVSQGEFLAIVGPSGSGKSTLLNAVAGLDTEFEGEVSLDGGSLLNGTMHTARIGVMFQEARLMPWLNVRDNLQLVLEADPQASEISCRLLEAVGLSEFESVFPGQLSGGMQRRLALARAFAVRPTLLLMDEPFLSLDAPTAARLRELLLDLWQMRHSMVLFVTHNLREALALADRVLFLSGRPGKVVLSWPVELPRPRDMEDGLIGELHDRILTGHPDLLAGMVNGDVNVQNNDKAAVNVSGRG